MNSTDTVQSIVLVTNTALAGYDCAWCRALKGADVHSAACPVGERYKQVQQLGGVPWPREKPVKAAVPAVSTDDDTRCLECGKSVEPHALTCDECLS